jgi:hypothetical protein
MNYLYAMMDEQTRSWIAQEVAETKYTADVEGENRWLTLIQNASQSENAKPTRRVKS